jgi:ADP-heptose:LPS heptosyltransferase
LLRSLERTFKRFLIFFLRAIIGSKTVSPRCIGAVHRILVIRQHNELGDMLCAVPLLRAMRECYPSARIALMTSPVSHEIMLHNRHVDDVILFDRRQFLGRSTIRVRRSLDFLRSLRAMAFDLAIVPSTVSVSFTSGFLAYASGARWRIGPGSIDGKKNASAFFFNVPVDLDWRKSPHRHQTLRNLDIASALLPGRPSLVHEITLTEDEVKRGTEFLRETKGTRIMVIGFHPGAGKAPNRWAPERFAEVANKLAGEFDAQVVVTLGPKDREAVQHMISGLSVGYEVLDNKYVRDVASILAGLDLFVTNDTGVMHIAAGSGTAVLSLFGPTDPEEWAPIGPKNRYIIGRNGDINSITTREVIEVAREMLRPNC